MEQDGKREGIEGSHFVELISSSRKLCRDFFYSISTCFVEYECD